MFGIARNVCFGIMGIRIKNKAKNLLFCTILRQDIAFFDGPPPRWGFSGPFLESLHGKRQPPESGPESCLAIALRLVGTTVPCRDPFAPCGPTRINQCGRRHALGQEPLHCLPV